MLWFLIAQKYSIAATGGLYCFIHYIQSPIYTFAASDNRLTNMASAKTCLTGLGRSSYTLALRPSTQLPPPFLLPLQQYRTAVQSANAAKYKRKDQPTAAKKKKSRTTYVTYDLRDAIQFSLVDAMRYAY